MSRRTITILVFVFCYALILYRWARIPVSDTTTEARVGVYGDAFSSRNVHSAAMWFRQIGYTKTKGLPVFNYAGNYNQSAVEVYTHYPPLPDIIGGIIARVLNTNEASLLAVFPLLLSIFFFFHLRKVLQKIVPGENAASLSWILLVTSCYFICWADDLHQHLYTELLKWVYIGLLYRLLTAEPKPWMLPTLCVIFFLQSLLTFESIPFLGIVTVGFFLLFRKRLFHPACLLLLAMPVIGVALHLYQNYLYLGTWEAVMADMKNAALKRMTGTGELGNELGRSVQGYDFLKMWTFELWFRIGRMFTLPGISFIIISAFALRDMYYRHSIHFRMAIIFFLAGIAWIFVMPQHAVIHTFTVKHLGVFVAFISGYGLMQYFALVKKHFATGLLHWRILHVVFIAFTCYGFLLNQFYYVYLKFGFAYPHLGTRAYLW
ncbi:MAG: hypothetical protein H7Y42_04710 [Chitinophagaceae bacterium]|nr:hypothetical protein [Chitinophagaceae bacterium]